MSTIKVSSCTLNLHALSFTHNLKKILESLSLASSAGAGYRLGPELEICGYNCEDHFLEKDTEVHCWEVLAELLKSGYTDGMMCDFGMVVEHCGCRYNCRVVCAGGWVVGIRPKMEMAEDGNYREGRWFARWGGGSCEFRLPEYFLEMFGDAGDDDVQERLRRSSSLFSDSSHPPPPLRPSTVPFGFLAFRSLDSITIGIETCEEMWTPTNTATHQSLQGVHIVGNGSGSHHELRKLGRRRDLMTSATMKNGGCYVYSNHRGCDGTRMYFDGSSSVTVNGEVVAAAGQFDLKEVEVITATVDVDAIR